MARPNFPLIPEQLIESVEGLSISLREHVERSKQIHDFDKQLAAYWLERRKNDPGIVKVQSEVDLVAEGIGDTIDLIIQVLAHCETPHNAQCLANSIHYLGRMGKRLRLSQDFDLMLRDIVAEMDSHYGYSVSGHNDRISIRSKARQILRKVEDALSSSSVKWNN